MFDIGWGEFVVIGTVALVVIGPKELPGVLRTVGQAVGKIRRMASEFQGQFQEALREADLDDARKTISGLNDSAASFNPIQQIRDEIKGVVEAKDASASAATASGAPLDLRIPEPAPVPDLTPEQIQAAFATEPLGAATPDVSAGTAPEGEPEVAPEKPKRARKKPAAASQEAPAERAVAPPTEDIEAQTPPRRRAPRKTVAKAAPEGSVAPKTTADEDNGA
jgi:sec-independent protein translocase protein TatB